MVKKTTNDDMAGSVSAPAGGAPDVKPAKSLWPKPYQEVRVEPSVDAPQSGHAPVVMPPVPPSDGDFETVPGEDYREPAVEEPAPKLDLQGGEPEAEEAESGSETPEPDEGEGAPPVVADGQAEDTDGEPDADAGHEAETGAQAEADEILARVEPAPEIVPDAEPAPLRVTTDERTASVFDAAERQDPVLREPGESRGARFVAMAAGIVVALALGAVAFMYGASGLGLKFGDDTTQTAEPVSPDPQPVPTEAANADELKAAQERVAELEARLKELEERSAEPAEQTSAIGQADTAQTTGEPAASDTARNDTNADAGEPQTPEPPAETAAAPVPTPEPKPNASRPPAETARVETRPAPPAQETAPREAAAGPGAPPRPLTPPREARVDPVPPPSYDTRPSYNAPGSPSPEMPVLQGWSVRDVYNGIAVVQGRGAPIEVEPGDDLPGGNRVLAIRRLGGNWAVITERGIIAGY